MYFSTDFDLNSPNEVSIVIFYFCWNFSWNHFQNSVTENLTVRLRCLISIGASYPFDVLAETNFIGMFEKMVVIPVFDRKKDTLFVHRNTITSGSLKTNQCKKYSGGCKKINWPEGITFTQKNGFNRTFHNFYVFGQKHLSSGELFVLKSQLWNLSTDILKIKSLRQVCWKVLNGCHDSAYFRRKIQPV